MSRLRGSKTVLKSAKLHPAEDAKLKRSGRNAREAIEYHNAVSLTPKGALEIDIHFLKKDIDDLKYYLISLEKKLEDMEDEYKELVGDVMEPTLEEKIDSLVFEFVCMYHTTPYYEDISVEEAIEMAHQGLARKADKIGVSFDDIKEAILNDFASKTQKFYCPVEAK